MQIARRRPLLDTIHVRIEPSVRQRAEAAAELAGVTLSDLVRAALERATRDVLNDAAREGAGA